MLLEKEPRLAAQIEGLEKRKKERAEKREALPMDDAVLVIKDRAARLDASRARYITAEEDLPRRRDTLAELNGRIAASLRRLDEAPGTDPASLVVPAAVAGALRALIESRSGIEERQRTTAVELETAKADADRAAEAFEKSGAAQDAAGETAFERLSAALDDAQRDDCRARLSLHDRHRRRLAGELDDKIERLRPWRGDAESLTRVAVSEACELETWRTALEAADREIERLESEETDLAAERDRQLSRAGAVKAETGVADDDEAAALRMSRDEAWRRHRAALDVASADVFEEQMNAHDAAADGRLAHAAALARVRQAADDLRATDADAKRNAKRLARARQQRQAVVDEIAASVAIMIRTGAADMPPDISLSRLAEWLRRREEIIAKLAEIRDEDLEIEHAREAVTKLHARLVGALAAAGAARKPTSDIETLMNAAQAAVGAEKDRRAKAEGARERLERARAALERRRDEARRAEEDDAGWRRDWAAALSRCWLGKIDPTPSSTEVRRILEGVTALEVAHGEHAALTARIATMERDQASFVAEVGALAKQAGETFDATRVLVHDDSLKRRLAEEAARRKARDELGKEIDRIAADISRAEDEMAELRDEADCMFALFGVDTLRAVDEKLRKAQRRAELRKTVDEYEAQLMEVMDADSPCDAKAALAGVDQNALKAEAAEIAEKLKEFSVCKQARFHSLQKANDALAAVGSDDDAARLEQERRTVLLEIEEGARDWLRVRLGVAAAERALDDYRRKHRSSMMKNASEAFRTISRGAYSGLDSQLTDKGEILIGVPAAGGAKLAPEMSKGTRFQLYLALRVAGYREFVERHGPVPFIADDILETFDDFRAEEAFRLFADMAKFGQVVYLSHHRHLCDIAREVCPSVTVHALPGIESPAAPGGELAILSRTGRSPEISETPG